MKTKEIAINKKTLYEGRVITFHLDEVKLPNSTIGTREYVKHPGGVGILAIKDGYIYLVEQYRYPFEENILEIPAGKLDKNEDPEKAALREFKEELGAVTKKITHLGDFYPTVGYSNEIIHLYYSEDFVLEEQNLDSDEFLNVKKIELNEFKNLVKTNKIKDGKTIAAYYLYKDKFNK